MASDSPLKPREMHRTLVLTALAALITGLAVSVAATTPACAQIGNIFSDPVPRPPGNLPRGNKNQPPPDEEEEAVPALPQGRVLPAPNRPRESALPGPVQSQPLAPPPGTTVVPQNAPPPVAVQPPQPGQAPQGGQNAALPPGANPALPGLEPGHRHPKGAPAAPATLQPA